MCRSAPCGAGDPAFPDARRRHNRLRYSDIAPRGLLSAESVARRARHGQYVLMTEPTGHEIKGITLRGRVIDKILDERTWKQRRFVALERDSGGQFFALHDATDERRDFHAIVGRWVEVEGDIWFQSLSVRTVVDLGDSPPT